MGKWAPTSAPQRKATMPTPSEEFTGGSYLKPGKDIADGDVVDVVGAGGEISAEDSSFGRANFYIEVRTPDGVEGRLNLNKTSYNQVAEVYGENTDVWVGRRIRASIESKIIDGKRVLVGYFEAVGDAQEKLTPHTSAEDSTPAADVPEPGVASAAGGSAAGG